MKLAFALLAFVATLGYLGLKLAGPLLRGRGVVARRTNQRGSAKTRQATSKRSVQA